MKKTAFLVNRTIKRADDVMAEIHRVFGPVGEFRIFPTDWPGHVRDLASEAVEQGFGNIIAVGGDGSVNEAVNGLLVPFRRQGGPGPDGYDWEAAAGIGFGLLPRGSGNDFARYFGIGPSMLELRNRITADNRRRIDVGWTSFTGKSGGTEERFFANITDVGMGGATVQHMEKRRIPWLSSNANYMKAILSAFLTYERTPVRWTACDETWEGKAMSVVVANGQYFGSGLGIAPDARIDDGQFSLITLGDISLTDYLKNMGKVRASQKISHPEVTYRESPRVLIEPAGDKELPIDMDGEFVGYCPLELVCVKGAVGFLV